MHFADFSAKLCSIPQLQKLTGFAMNSMAIALQHVYFHADSYKFYFRDLTC